MINTCSICIEKKAVLVKCNGCNFESCKSCTKRYLLESTQDAECMSCHRQWDRNFMLTQLPKSWLNGEYKKRREDLLFERERGMMPATQIAIEEEEERKRQKQHLRNLEYKEDGLVHELREILLFNSLPVYVSKKISDERLDDLKPTDQVKYKKIESDLSSLRDEIMKLREGTLVQKALPGLRLVRPCPAEKCNGFIRRCDWSCGLCKRVICKECHGSDTESHKCLESDIDTAKLIMRETKPCPSCAVPTFKIIGCAQMWCTQCHKAWNWTSGLLETGRVHNPHYYEWMRQQAADQGAPREHMDIPCGGLPTPRQLHYLLLDAGVKSISPIYRMASYHLGLVMHIWEVESLRYRPGLGDNMELRMRFMKQEISEKTFKKHLQQREKKRQKYKEYYEILTTFRDVSVDIFNRLSISDVEKEITRLCIYTRQTMESVARKYDARVPYWCTDNYFLRLD